MDETNEYYADRLNVAWEILRHVAPVSLPRKLQGELGPVIDDVLEAAARLRRAPEEPAIYDGDRPPDDNQWQVEGDAGESAADQ
jgi:hypothetical protein